MALSDEQIDRVLAAAPRVPPMYAGWVADQRRLSARAIEAEVRKDYEALIRQLVEYIEQNTCQHEETHRGGAIWEICDGCTAQWADDRGGKPKFAWAPVVLAARARLEEKPCA